MASAIAVGFLAVPLMMPVSAQIYRPVRDDLVAGSWEWGLWGFVLHAAGNLQRTIGSSRSITSSTARLPWRLCYFPNLMVLGIIALWQLRAQESRPGYATRR